jgi:hypothetical protein
MKRILILIIFILSGLLPSYAEGGLEDVDTTDYTHTTQNLKYYSEKQYQDAINRYKNKFQKPKQEKAKNKRTPTSISGQSDVNTNPEFTELQSIINHKGSIMIPAYCKTDAGQEINPGYYTLEYIVESNGEDWLVLSQGSNKIAKIVPHKADSADEKTINYAYAVGKDNRITLLYGNIDIAVEAELFIEE